MSPGTGANGQRPRRLGLPLWAGLAALGIVVLAVAASTLVPRLVPQEQFCTTIGYSSALQVTLTGESSDVAHVQVRDGEEWQPPPNPGQDTTVPAIPASRDGDTWTFTLFYPDGPVALRALDNSGEVLAQTEKAVDWVRVGGTEECGGPTEGSVTWTL
ncbi:hypothetical protein M1843_19530 [Isoptericola sp. 4D.3]|uniref:Secreted protein n=1 Tax=Isoptericola peretonis TaxID=2918523 RepID=A0ABT0J8W9_9MICO|nr:hypothetical protein [Isoptericola sp. 4D.3]